ncbi:MAG: hypothetical protein K0R76_1041 [Alphaproteobacteria bacterium]|nr:hypothetical protein [Alphaproteobacteria bacterium]
MALQTKRALMIALLMATSFSQGGHGMDEVPNLPGFKKTFIWSAAALLNAGPSDAWQVGLGPAFPLNRRPVNGSLHDPSDVGAVGLDDGNFALVWHESLNQSGFRNVVARIFDPNEGMPITGKLKVSAVPIPPHTINSYAEGTIISCGDRFAVAWADGSSVLARIFFVNGEHVTDPVLINEPDTSLERGGVTVACLTKGDFAIAWFGLDPIAKISHISARILSPIGKPVTREFNINQDTLPTGFQAAPRILGLSSGDFLATFLDLGLSSGDFNEIYRLSEPLYKDKANMRLLRLSDKEGLVYKVKGRLFWPNGTSQSDEFTINQDTTMPTSAALSAEITANSNTIITVYTRYDESKDEDLLLGRHIKAGAPTGDEFPISATIAKEVASFSIAALNETALVGWNTRNNAGRGNSMVRFVSESGPLTREAALTNAMANDTTVIGLASGEGLGIWGTVDEFSNYTTNYARRVFLSHTTETPTSSPTTVAPTRSPTRAPTTSSASRLTPGWLSVLPTRIISNMFYATVKALFR